jgi:hypothetical protein
MRGFIFLIVAMASTANAEMTVRNGTVGNGGDGVVCDLGNGNFTYEILDAYEARQVQGWEYDFLPGSHWKDIVRDTIDLRIAPYFKVRAERYKTWLGDLDNPSESDYVDKKLNDVPDSNHIAIDNNCEIKQIAIQRSDEELDFGGKRFTFQLRLWQALSEQQKAVLALHEIILRDAIKVKHENSIPTRYLNSYFFSRIHQEPDIEKIFGILKKVFPNSLSTEIKGLPFGHPLLVEKVIYAVDKSGSNSTTDPGAHSRKKVHQVLDQKYAETNYFQSAMFYGNIIQSEVLETSNKEAFGKSYRGSLENPDDGASSLMDVVFRLEELAKNSSYQDLSRYNIVIMIDGELSHGQTDIRKLFLELIKLQSEAPFSYSFVTYGQPIDGVTEVADQLGARVYTRETIDQIRF